MHEEVFIKGSRWKKKKREREKSGVREGTEARVEARCDVAQNTSRRRRRGGWAERERETKKKRLWKTSDISSPTVLRRAPVFARTLANCI